MFIQYTYKTLKRFKNVVDYFSGDYLAVGVASNSGVSAQLITVIVLDKSKYQKWK